MSKATRILIVDTYYPEFVRKVYEQRPELQSASYQEQLAALLQYHFGTGNTYSRNLNGLGYVAQDCIVDNRILQTKWANEHGITIRSLPRLPYLRTITDRLPLYNPLYTILKAQIAEFKPDVLYMQNLSFCDPITLRSLKRKVKLLVGQIACPLPPTSFVKPFDLILTSFPHFVDRIKAIGPASEYFKIGFDQTVLPKLNDVTEKKYDVVFVGGFTAVHDTATKALEALARTTRVDVWGYGIEHLAADSPLRKHYHGEAWGMEMYRVIKQAKVCINRHSAAAEAYANNMRLFETTGLGTLLLTDAKQNLNDMFTVGTEVVDYSSTKELVDRTTYYLQHETEREQIALAGQRRTLRDHTYYQRMQELDTILQSYL